ncbi:MAG: ImmA/IrrE family metallo-endopeptidase [Oscillospiraceae bacterium]|jgi:Zn-dependent peptidase ImmA (M78 family)
MLSNSEIEELGAGIVGKFYGESLEDRTNVDIEALAREFFRLTIVTEKMAGTDRDKIGFLSDGLTWLTVKRGPESVEILYPRNTVVISCDIENGRKNFTIAHETAHYALEKYDPQAACFQSEFKPWIGCSSKDYEENISNAESQANRLASSLLMPEKMVKKALAENGRPGKVPMFGKNAFLPADKAMLRKLKEQLGVSYQALVIRLEAMGRIEHRNYDEYLALMMGDRDAEAGM